MAYGKRLLSLIPSIALLVATVHAQPEGVAPQWDVRKDVGQLSADVRSLKPILEQVTPAQWLEKDAPEAYVTQHKSALNEIGYLIGSAEKLAGNPEKLSLALDTMFRLQSLEAMLTSLIEGIRRYQNPALADLLRSNLTANMNHRERLRGYVVDLAQIREQEFEIANREAQRCRGELLKQPPAGSSRPKPQTKK